MSSPRPRESPPLPGTVWLLGWVSFFTDFASEMIYPLLPIFLTRVLGANAMAVGVIEGVAEASNSALKIVSGRLSDRWNRRRPLVLAGYALSSAVRPAMAIAASWGHVLLLRFVDRVGKGIRGAPRDAMLARLAPVDQRGRVFGFQRAMDHAGAVAGPLAASAFLVLYPGAYRLLFGLTLLPGLVVIALLLILREPPEGRTSCEALAAPPAAEADRPRLPRPLYASLGIILLFSLGNASDAFLLLRLGDAGIGPAWIPFLWAALHVVKSGSSLLGGGLADRWGRRPVIAAGWVVYAAIYAGFALSSSSPALVSLFVVYGVYFGLTEGAERALVADLAPAALRGTAFGAYNAVLGVGGLLSSVLFGWVWTAVSPQAAFGLGALLALAAGGALAAVPLQARTAASADAILADPHEADSRYQ
ncbi:MAG TPA: MFS transporter [Vicinamibacterales bacterium]|nr:MFS transporter [Vicinamibacterales bacterium]